MERQAKNQGWGGRPDRRTRPGSTRGERPGENSPHLLGSIGERESKKNSLRGRKPRLLDDSSSSKRANRLGCPGVEEDAKCEGIESLAVTPAEGSLARSLEVLRQRVSLTPGIHMRPCFFIPTHEFQTLFERF